LAGWASLITPRSLESRACREELTYALERALSARGDGFLLIGLIHGVAIADAPTPLRVRLCVSLSSPTWVEEVRAGLERRRPHHPRSETGDVRVAIHHPYQGNAALYAVEFRPRFGELRYWVIAYPADFAPSYRGTGPAGGGGVGGMLTEYFEGNIDLGGRQMKFFGSGNAITPGTAAYVVFAAEGPDYLAFGAATAPFTIPQQWMSVRTGPSPR